jgi:hypothetical protein
VLPSLSEKGSTGWKQLGSSSFVGWAVTCDDWVYAASSGVWQKIGLIDYESGSYMLISDRNPILGMVKNYHRNSTFLLYRLTDQAGVISEFDEAHHVVYTHFFHDVHAVIAHGILAQR